MSKRLFRLTNRRIRILVGIFLAALFCIQCTRPTEVTEARSDIALAGSDFGAESRKLTRIEKLAETDHIALLEMCLQNYRSNVQGFTCTFSKQERLDGTLRDEQEMQVKHLRRPFSVAMAWTKNPPRGDRILYVEGKRDNQMLVRPTSGFLRALVGGSVLREPDGPDAMQSTLRPVNLFGFGRGLESLLDVYRQAEQSGDLEFSRADNAVVAGRDCVVLERILPAKGDYPAHKTLTYVDVEHLVPVCIEAWDWDGEFQSRYTYKNVKFNTGLTEADFAPRANEIQAK